MEQPLIWLLAGLALAVLAGVFSYRRAKRRAEGERAAQWAEAQRRAEADRAAAERAAAEAAERQAADRARQIEAAARRRALAEAATRAQAEQRARSEQQARETAERERLERERAAHDAAERARAEREQAQREQAERELAERRERERIELEQAERAAAELQRAEAERVAHEQAQREETQRLQAERERAERERADRERAEAAERDLAAARTRRAPKPPAETLVMVADDSKVVRIKTGRLLAQHEYRVCYAGDGDEAARQLRQQPPDLVITDVEMPGLDGFELTRLIRSDAATAHIPVIMITGADDRHGEAAERSGVSVLMGKPYADEALVANVRRLLQPDAAMPARIGAMVG